MRYSNALSITHHLCFFGWSSVHIVHCHSSWLMLCVLHAHVQAHHSNNPGRSTGHALAATLIIMVAHTYYSTAIYHAQRSQQHIRASDPAHHLFNYLLTSYGYYAIGSGKRALIAQTCDFHYGCRYWDKARLLQRSSVVFVLCTFQKWSLYIASLHWIESCTWLHYVTYLRM